MTRYVAFLGSINVGGNRLTMAELRHALEREDFVNVETVVASGNVLFDHDDRPTTGLEEKLEYVLRQRFDMRSIAAVRSRDEVAEAISGNPFAGDGPDAGEENRVHTMFLERLRRARARADGAGASRALYRLCRRGRHEQPDSRLHRTAAGPARYGAQYSLAAADLGQAGRDPTGRVIAKGRPMPGRPPLALSA
jgi:hypothetical protein